YSLARVLKQWAHVATIFFLGRWSKVSLSVSTFCWASIWYTNSLPMRRAGSPVHVSPSPRIAKLTPASCNKVATARVVFFAPSSNAPAQPTQNRYSQSPPSLTRGTTKSRPFVQSERVLGGAPHGLPLPSRLRSITPASDGKRDSIRTWYRRMS